MVVGVGGVLCFQGPAGAPDGGVAADGKSGPVRADTRTTPLAVAGGGRSASLPQRDTDPFSMLGVTWTDAAARLGGTVEVRTRSAESGTWSAWLRLDGDSGQGESGAARGGTEPAWVGPSDGVEARLRAADGATSDRLPAGLRLDMIDPGTGRAAAMEPAAFAVEESPAPAEATGPSEPAGGQTASTGPGGAEADPEEPGAEGTPGEPESGVSAAPSGTPVPSATPSGTPAPSVTVSGSPSPTPTVSVPPGPPSGVPQPPITSRADWGADESISPEEPGYLPGGRIKAVVVHHTAESNGYTCEQAPAVVRGIYAYHVQQLGWKDIGYNFVVDKCGTVYEGRKGGVDRPVLGAHAYGFNSETTGISVLGAYTDTAPSQAAMASVAQVAAWKLGQYGVDPAGTTTLTAGASGRSHAGRTWESGARLTFPAVHGHRDGYNTQCPGDAFYGRLGTVRSWAAGPVTGLAVRSVTGAGLSGTTYYTRAGITVNWATGTPSSFVSRYEVLVDGKPAASAAATAASAEVTLAAGTHQVAVRAVHQSGRTATTPAATVVAETTAPGFSTMPNLALRTGTVDTAAVPLTLRWKATDNAALKEVRLTAPVTRTYGPTTYGASHTARSGAATTWKATARDQAGNARSASVTGTPVVLQETAAARSGAWSTRSSSGYLGGRSYSSTAGNASLTWTFTGRSAAWVVSRASGSGQAHVYVDGVRAATVDLKSATTRYRDAIWTRTWSTSAKHTVKIVVVGTKGRPTVTTDGLVYLR